MECYEGYTVDDDKCKYDEKGKKEIIILVILIFVFAIFSIGLTVLFIF